LPSSPSPFPHRITLLSPRAIPSFGHVRSYELCQLQQSEASRANDATRCGIIIASRFGFSFGFIATNNHEQEASSNRAGQAPTARWYKTEERARAQSERFNRTHRVRSR
jgi:hypothetical protein